MFEELICPSHVIESFPSDLFNSAWSTAIQREFQMIPVFMQGVRAMSILQEIPASRTCAQADIEPHWCACMNWRPLDLTSSSSFFFSSSSSSLASKLTHAAVDFLNSLTGGVRSQCVELTLKQMLQVSVMEVPKQLRQFKQSKDADGFVPDLRSVYM